MSYSAAYRRTTARPGRGFTLVELLVTIVIIGILAGIVMGALQAARQTAREARTKSLIARLDRIIMQKYEAYRTRRVAVDTSSIPRDENYVRSVALARLQALRDLIRMEMPERFNDIDCEDTSGNSLVPYPFSWGSIQRPALSQRYYRKYRNGTAPSAKYGSAECLYMIIASGSADERSQFSESDIGDKDGDGWPEFHDGWGEPIYFLRWAPGFSNSAALGFAGDSDIQSGDHKKDHDPFDTRKVDPGAFKMIPLIFSGGPDEEPGLKIDDTATPYFFNGDPTRDTTIGSPDSPGDGDHYDNIHNHRIEAR